MSQLPVTVISGYLGAGKTTLINNLLSQDHGLRLMVLVNDFGAINIDAALLASATKDTIALTNGCVCCTMGADLFMAVGDALDRSPRPDHLIIEASGIADPAAIANVALAEPDLSYSGIITLADGTTITDLLDDPLIAPQIAQQISAADLVLITKTPTPDAKVIDRLSEISPRPVLSADHARFTEILLGVMPLPRKHTTAPHPAYTAWHLTQAHARSTDALRTALDHRPAGLFRLKGAVQTPQGPALVQVVGQHITLTTAPADMPTTLVGLGLRKRLTVADMDEWWRGIKNL